MTRPNCTHKSRASSQTKRGADGTPTATPTGGARANCLPPIRVVEGLNGDLRICDGHRRWRAAQLAGVMVPAWVSPLFFSRINGKPLVASGLTYELALLSAFADGLPAPADQVACILREVAAGKYTSLPDQFPALFQPARPFPLGSIALPAAVAA